MTKQELITRIETYAAAKVTGNTRLMQFAIIQLDEALNSIFPAAVQQEQEPPTTE